MGRKRRQLYAGLLALALTLTLTGCGGTPASPASSPTAALTAAPVSERVFALPYSPNAGFHPISGTNRVNLTLAPLMCRGLFSLDRSFTPQKDLCAGYTVSEDGLTWTFTLAEATFSDGSPLTAAEAVASLNKARRTDRFSGRLADISKVAAADGAVVVTLSRPNGALPALLDVPIVKETGEAWPLGTGAYYLTEAGDGLALTAREGANTPLSTIPLRPVEAGDDLIYAFDAAEASLVDTDLTGSTALGYSGRFETTDYPTTTLLYVGLNMAKRTGPCWYKSARKALSYALDREDTVTRCLAGHAIASALLIHPHAVGYPDRGLTPMDFDLGAAKACLVSDDWTMGDDGIWQKGRTRLTLCFLVNQDNSYKAAVAEALAANLEELGCEITLEKLPWDDFVTALEKGDFDLYLGETTMTADFDPKPLVGTDGALNYCKFSDKNLDGHLEQYRSAQGEERKEYASLVFNGYADAAAVVPICFKNGSVLTQWGQVSGMSPTQRDVFAGLENWKIGE